MDKKQTFLGKARGWASSNNLFGSQAFLRYVMLNFTEILNQTSNDFVFKGGNLLWVYIKTPRSTIDLDLATRQMMSHARVREAIEKACEGTSDIRFSLKSFQEIEKDGMSGASLVIGYTTDQGATNQFEVDIVYGVETDSHQIFSPVHAEQKILSATIENIIIDKLSACRRFGAGNTRMKDYDDLWRLSRAGVVIDSTKFNRLLEKESLPPELRSSWIGQDTERHWKAHRRKYPDLPEDLAVVVAAVNQWLAML